MKQKFDTVTSFQRSDGTERAEAPSRQPAVGAPIAKVPTGISGFDDVLFGGLPQGRTTLLGGGPGTGKTIVALEFLYRGALAGERGLFVSFEERGEALRANAAAIGWDVGSLEDAGKLKIMDADIPITLCGPASLTSGACSAS